MKTKFVRYCDNSFEIGTAIRTVYKGYFQRRPQTHYLTWDFERQTNLFGKQKIVAIHLYSDCAGLLIGYRGQTINQFKDELAKINPDMKVVIHDCEHIC